MKSVTVRGAWAQYEQQHINDQQTIVKLTNDVSKWKTETLQLQTSLISLSEQASKGLSHKDVEIPCLKHEILALREKLTKSRNDYESERIAKEEKVQELETTAEMALNTRKALCFELEQSSNLQLKSENQLKFIVDKIGLTDAEANVFVKDIELARIRQNKVRQDIADTQRSLQRMKKDYEKESEACVAMISENKRLMDEARDLQRQISDMHSDQYRLLSITNGESKAVQPVKIQNDLIRDARNKAVEAKDTKKSITPIDAQKNLLQVKNSSSLKGAKNAPSTKSVTKPVPEEKKQVDAFAKTALKEALAMRARKLA